MSTTQDVDQTGDDQETTAEGQQTSMNNYPGAFGFDAMGRSFSNVNVDGDFNQMQMMMAMQNNMMPNSFSFPMMGMCFPLDSRKRQVSKLTMTPGMPGAAMDPMMQTMYMNGGFGSQGMGMNMNMMGGTFGNGTGSGPNNWNGQQSWNVGQDNYNHPHAMGNGDYGSYNSTFETGYNQQGNFGHQNQFNSYRGYGRGRGRRGNFGGYYRGGYGQNSYGGRTDYQDRQFSPQQYAANASGQVLDGPNDSLAESGKAGDQADVDEFGRSLRSGSGEDQGGKPERAGISGSPKADSGDPGTNTEDSIAVPRRENATREPGPSESSDQTPVDATGKHTSATDGRSPAASGGGGDAMHPADSISMRRPGSSGEQVRQAGISGMAPPATKTPDVPLNAPSGPKAMRQGLPNTSLLHLRARGYDLPDDRPQSPKTNGTDWSRPRTERHGPEQSRSSSPKTSERRETESYRERSGDGSKDRDRNPDRETRDRGHSESRSSRSRSRSHSHDRRDYHRHKRYRSDSLASGSHEDDRRRRSRQRSSKKHSTYEDDEEPKSARSRDEKQERSRSASPDDSRRSSHRSRRDRESDKRRERDRERGRDEEREHRRRSHKARDYDRNREREREREKDKARNRSKDQTRDRSRDRNHSRDQDRERERERERDREHRHRESKKSTEEPPTPVEESEKEFNPPTGPRVRSFEIKGASFKSREAAEPGRRSSQASSQVAPSGVAAADPYAAEREKSSRDRLAAEVQRLAGLSGSAGSKRTREDADDSRRNRRKGRRGEAVSLEDAGDRLRRGEAERESR